MLGILCFLSVTLGNYNFTMNLSPPPKTKQMFLSFDVNVHSKLITFLRFLHKITHETLTRTQQRDDLFRLRVFTLNLSLFFTVAFFELSWMCGSSLTLFSPMSSLSSSSTSFLKVTVSVISASETEDTYPSIAIFCHICFNRYP